MTSNYIRKRKEGNTKNLLGLTLFRKIEIETRNAKAKI